MDCNAIYWLDCPKTDTIVVIYPHPVDYYCSPSCSDPIFRYIGYINCGLIRLVLDFRLCIVHTFLGSSNNVNCLDSGLFQHCAYWLDSIYVFLVVTDVFISPTHSCELVQCKSVLNNLVFFACCWALKFQDHTLFVVYSSFLFLGLFIHTHQFFLKFIELSSL